MNKRIQLKWLSITNVQRRNTADLENIVHQKPFPRLQLSCDSLKFHFPSCKMNTRCFAFEKWNCIFWKYYMAIEYSTCRNWINMKTRNNMEYSYHVVLNFLGPHQKMKSSKIQNWVYVNKVFFCKSSLPTESFWWHFQDLSYSCRIFAKQFLSLAILRLSYSYFTNLKNRSGCTYHLRGRRFQILFPYVFMKVDELKFVILFTVLVSKKKQYLNYVCRHVDWPLMTQIPYTCLLLYRNPQCTAGLYS